MPDISQYIQKHVTQARRNGFRQATESAVAEACLWGLGLADTYIFNSGKPIWDDQWDICIVADACRYDLWQAVSREYDWLETHSAWSVGSASPEWYSETFAPEVVAGLDTGKIGVITCNPFASKPSSRMDVLKSGSTPVDRHDFAVTEYVHQENWGCEINGNYLDVTAPHVMTDRAHAVWGQYDIDRLVVHYMQPHLPFRARPEWFTAREDLNRFGEPGHDYQSDSKEVWMMLRDGELDRTAVWEAYKDNLRWVLDDVNRLVDALDAEFLITSDHGNGIGEFGVWSHPPNRPLPCLRRVPWVTVSGRGNGGFESEGESEPETDRDIDEQLRALGYKF